MFIVFYNNIYKKLTGLQRKALSRLSVKTKKRKINLYSLEKFKVNEEKESFRNMNKMSSSSVAKPCIFYPKTNEECCEISKNINEERLSHGDGTKPEVSKNMKSDINGPGPSAAKSESEDCHEKVGDFFDVEEKEKSYTQLNPQCDKPPGMRILIYLYQIP